MSDEEMVVDLLLAWEAQFDAGVDLPAEELCRDCPKLVGRVTGQIRRLKASAWLRRPVDGNAKAVNICRAGDVLAGNYRLDIPLGEGGTGVVWRGFDLTLQRPVAVKVPHRRTAIHDVGDPFLAEARRAVQLKHPGIVSVHFVGWDQDSCFIVSELIDGESLAARILRERLAVDDVVRIVREVAGVLTYAHAQGFIHRDVKPANILLGRDGRVYLADFGLALSISDRLGLGGGAAGTPAYMAPEQIRADDALDGRCDIYSLGVVLFELLTGHRPFQVDSAIELRKLILTEQPPHPQALNPHVPLGLARCCLRCLKIRPEHRFTTAQSLEQALREFEVPSSGKRWVVRLSGSVQRIIRRFGAWVTGGRKRPTATVARTWSLAGIASVGRWGGEEMSLRPQSSWIGETVIFRTPLEHSLRNGAGSAGNPSSARRFESFTVAVEEADTVGFWQAGYKRLVVKGKVVRLAEAVNWFTSVIDSDPTGSAYRCRGLAHHLLGHHDTSIADLYQAVRLGFDDPLAVLYRGQAKAAQFDLQGALADFDRAIQLDPSCAAAFVGRGTTRVAMGDVFWGGWALNRDPLLPRMVPFQEVNPDITTFYGIALEDFNGALLLSPDSVAALMGRAVVRKVRNELVQAAEDYTRAIELEPHTTDAVLRRAEVRFCQGDFARAIQDFDRFIASEPDNAEAHLERAKGWLQMGQYDRAILDCSQAFCIGRLSPWVERNAVTTRAIAYILKRDYDRAIDEYDRAIARHPEFKYEYLTNRTLAVQAKGDLTRAIDDWTARITEWPGDTEAMFQRANAWLEAGNVHQAIRDYTQAIDYVAAQTHLPLDGNLARVLSHRGHALRENGEYGRAVSDLDESLRLDPTGVLSWFPLAERAWIWAACPIDTFRDGARAVEAATRACESLVNANGIEALAASYAEVGRFGEAVKFQRQAIASPSFQKYQPKAVEAARRRLELYIQGRPFRDEPNP